MNAWRLAFNSEPAGYTMRWPPLPNSSTPSVTIFVGIYPQYTVWSGYCYYRLEGETAWESAALVVLVDIGVGAYWFVPSWTIYPSQIDYATIPLAPGVTPFVIISEFSWPEGAGGSGGATFFFHGAVLDISLQFLVTDVASWDFQYR